MRAAGLVLGMLAVSAFAQADTKPAPPTANYTSVWHQGRVIGDLEPILAFYHGALGLSLPDHFDKPPPFASRAAVNAFVGSPEDALFRAVQLPIPGTISGGSPPGPVNLEAFQLRDIGKRQPLPALSDTGASNLVFKVHDLPAVLAAAKRTGAAVITPGGRPVAVEGSTKGVMIRDPDGYPVELREAAPDDPALGSATVIVVADLDASLTFYTGFFGAGVQATGASAWRPAGGFGAVRGLGHASLRTASMTLPGSNVQLQLVQLKGEAQKPYRPDYRDIGHAHIALYTKDIARAYAATQAAGAQALSGTGTWTTFSPTLKGFYTRDPDGFFLEVIERD